MPSAWGICPHLSVAVRISASLTLCVNGACHGVAQDGEPPTRKARGRRAAKDALAGAPAAFVSASALMQSRDTARQDRAGPSGARGVPTKRLLALLRGSVQPRRC